MPVPLLYDIINPREPEAVEREVFAPLLAIDPAFDPTRLRRAYSDTILLFQGRYPGYHASDTWYHDLEHTSAVLLCVAGMLHGAYHQGLAVSSRGKELALLAALFHDVGLIRRVGEEGAGTGARFTVGHERRSIAFLEQYCAANGFAPQDSEDAGHMIACTVLSASLDAIPFRSAETRLLGCMVGSGDLIAQMADRAYLEKLLLLYREFEEARLPGYHSELELLEKTSGFYEHVVKRRLSGTLENVAVLLEPHARHRWGLEGDPYQRSIESNLAYLAKILERDRANYRGWLRRGNGAVRGAVQGG